MHRNPFICLNCISKRPSISVQQKTWLKRSLHSFNQSNSVPSVISRIHRSTHNKNDTTRLIIPIRQLTSTTIHRNESHPSSSTTQQTVPPPHLQSHRISSSFAFLNPDNLRIGSNGSLKWKCTEFDVAGKVTTVGEEIDKLDFASKHSLQPRDLRKLDPRFVHQFPAILVRESAILVNLVDIRALIKSDKFLLFDSIGSKGSYYHSVFVYNLQETLSQRYNILSCKTPSSPSQSSPSKSLNATNTPRLSPSPSTNIPSSSLSTMAHLPYEFVCLETILQAVVISLDKELEQISTPVHELISRLMKVPSSHEDANSTNTSGGLSLLSTLNLRLPWGLGRKDEVTDGDGIDVRRDLVELYHFANKFSNFETKVKNVRDVVNDLLECDEDLVNMYLSRKSSALTVSSSTATTPSPSSTHNQHHPSNVNHHEIEILLENYLSMFEELADSVDDVNTSISNTERYINLVLDAQRNALLVLELRFCMFGVACSSGAVLTGLFGMNLMNGLENEPGAFGAVLGLTSAVCGGVLWYGLWRIRRLRQSVGKLYKSPLEMSDRNR